MLKRLAVFTIAIMAAFDVRRTVLRAQTAPPGQQWATRRMRRTSITGRRKNGTHSPPPESYWEKMKSGPAPKRDLSGIWDAGFLDGGVQPNGAFEYPDDPEHRWT